MSSTSSTLPNLFVLGDSISMHYGPYLEAFVAEKFLYDRKKRPADLEIGDNLNTPVSLQGDNGGDSSMILDYLRFRKAENPIPAGVLLLNCGLHDIKKIPPANELQIGPADYERNLRLILKEARTMSLSVIWVRTTPVIDEIHNARSSSMHRFSADLDQYNSIADRVMKEAGLPVIDLNHFTWQFLPEGFCDHVHYTPEVRKLQAAFITGALFAQPTNPVINEP